MDLQKLIDQSDTLSIVSEAQTKVIIAEEGLKDGFLEGILRTDLVKEYARALGDFAIKDALRYLAQIKEGSALKTEELKMVSAFGRIAKLVKDVRGEDFLSDEEYSLVKRWVEDAVVIVLEDKNEWVDLFYNTFEQSTFERVIGEREKEMARLKVPYTEKREQIKKKLRESKNLINQREVDIHAYADAVTFEQIYEANRQYEGNPIEDEEERRSGMFTHLISSWKAIEDLSEYETSYISPEEAQIVIEDGLKITRNFYADYPDFLKTFEKAFKEIFPERTS